MFYVIKLIALFSPSQAPAWEGEKKYGLKILRDLFFTINPFFNKSLFYF
jgi:hypothetical protein